ASPSQDLRDSVHRNAPLDTKARLRSDSSIPKCLRNIHATVVQLGPGINLGARLTCLSFLSSDTQGILIVIGLDPTYLIRYGILLKHFDCAIEMEISLYLCQLARNIAEKSQLLINTFAKPIEQLEFELYVMVAILEYTSLWSFGGDGVSGELGFAISSCWWDRDTWGLEGNGGV
ncbi:hypothetical protein Tco_1433620, partial [Tanacetum coccineum]